MDFGAATIGSLSMSAAPIREEVRPTSNSTISMTPDACANSSSPRGPSFTAGRTGFDEREATVFVEDAVIQKTLPEYRIEGFLSADQVAVLELPPDSLSLSDLHAYVRILNRRGENSERYSLAFYQKICLPLTTGVMVLVSLSFIFGSTRTQNAWHRIFLGMLAGTTIYLANQIFGQLALVFHVPPLPMILLRSVSFFSRRSGSCDGLLDRKIRPRLAGSTLPPSKRRIHSTSGCTEL